MGGLPQSALDINEVFQRQHLEQRAYHAAGAVLANLDLQRHAPTFRLTELQRMDIRRVSKGERPVSELLRQGL